MNLPPTIPVYRSPHDVPLTDMLAIPINDKKGMLKLMEELGVYTPKPRNTKPHSYWIPYAWMARMIAETVVPKKGVGSPKAGSSKSGSPKAGKPKKRAGKPNVSKAVRVVLRRVGIEATRENENILRVVTYKVMKKPWPPGMKRLLGGLPTGEPITEMVAPELVVATAPEPEIAVDEDADDYIDADLRAELLEEERREEQRRIAEEQDCADRERRFEIERRLVTQMNAARGQDPDADEGYVGD